MTSRRLWVLVSLLLVIACRGPKSTPEDTVDSFFSAYEAHDADALVAMTWPETLKRSSVSKLHDFYWENIYGIRSMEVTKFVTRTGKDTAQAQSSVKYVWRVRGENPQDHEEEISLLLHEVDGKWYVEPPGTSKVQPW